LRYDLDCLSRDNQQKDTHKQEEEDKQNRWHGSIGLQDKQGRKRHNTPPTGLDTLTLKLEAATISKAAR
jgi:hypothetical protein